PDGSADWNEALLAPAEIRVHMWVGHGRGAKESPRISVRLGTRDLVPGEIAACARLCFDHDRLVPNLGKLVGNDARGDVDDSTRRIGHDHWICRFGKSVCACAPPVTNTQAAAAPPSATSNSRRPMVTVIRPSRARCVKKTIPDHERAVPN